VLKWTFDEPDSHVATRLTKPPFEPVVPDFLFAEVANGLWRQACRGHLPWPVAADAIKTLPRILRNVVPVAGLTSRALQIARDLDHPVYDCLYLALAQSLDLPMVTADERLIAKATRSPGFDSVLHFSAWLDRVG
jgi:predicted nucleic acid-binding protein